MALATYKPNITKESAASYNYVGGLYNSSVEVNLQALAEIAKMGEGQAVAQGYLPEVLRLLSDDGLSVKCAALDAVGTMGEAVMPAIEQVIALLDDQSSEVQCAALSALGGLGPTATDYAGDVVVFLASEYPSAVRAAATKAIGDMKAGTYTDELKACLKDQDTAVVKAACLSVAALEEDGQTLAPDVAACLSSPDAGVRTAAATALKMAGGPGEKQAEAVAALLSDADNMARLAAVEFFESAGTAGKKAVPKAAENLSSKDGSTLAASVMALGHMKASKYAKEVSGLLGNLTATDSSVALSAAGVEKKLPAVLRRPACAAAMALASMGDEGAAYASEIEAGLKGEAPQEVVVSFVKALGMMGKKGPATKITELLKETAAPIREAACFALGEMDTSADAVAALLKDSHPGVRAAAASAIGKMEFGGPPFASHVAALFGDKVAKVKIAAIKAIGSLGAKGELYATQICILACSGDTSVSLCALGVLGDMGERGAAHAEDLVTLLDSPVAAIREAALKSLAKMGEEATAFLPEIKKACMDPLESVRAAADSCAETLSAPPAA